MGDFSTRRGSNLSGERSVGTFKRTANVKIVFSVARLGIRGRGVDGEVVPNTIWKRFNIIVIKLVVTPCR